MNIPNIHLAIMQPLGYVHSLGFLDQARYFRWQFRRLGAKVTLAKNRLRHDAVNFVFGAHLGLPLDWATRHDCVIVNLEQLGDGGARVSPEYLQLLRNAPVVDYDADNLLAYGGDASRVVLLPYGHAPYLAQPAPALEDRPIDLLFFGSMNDRRRAFIQRVEALGVGVACFDSPLYGDERDTFIRQAKAVLNCHFYESSRFEQARAFQCLSMGTAFISERGPGTRPSPAFEPSVFWLDPTGDDIELFFGQAFRTPAFYEAARTKLHAFTAQDPLPAYEQALALAQVVRALRDSQGTEAPWRPNQVNLGSGKDYKPGWLNLDILDRAEPDLVLDLGRPQPWPLTADGCTGGQVTLEAGQLDTVYANNVLEHVPDLPQLMGNVLTLLKTGGRFIIEVPYEKALTAWQDPTHLRALNENSWVYYTDWFWYLGWFEHRFELQDFKWLDLKHQAVAREQAAFMRVVLRKVETTLRERVNARAMRPDFGGLADDPLPPVEAPMALAA